MDFNDTKEEAQFREEVNTWLSENAEKKQHARDIYKAVSYTHLTLPTKA